MLRQRTSRCLCRLFSSQATATTTDVASSVSAQLPFNVPKKIKRGPTDILKALSETVGEDSTAPHYAFIDDPTLIPSQTNMRRTAFLSREMGRRAARELAMEWPTLFMYDRDEPRLNAFRPTKLPPVDQVEPTETNLRARIEAKRVVDAAALYERMRAADVEVSAKLQMDLFELVAFYNGADPPLVESELPGVRMFHSDGPLFQKIHGQPTIWQSGGVADLLFELLDQNDPRVSSSMIAGLCKFRSDASVKRAWQLLQTMREKKLKPTVEAYEWLLRACFQLNDERPVGESVSLIFDYMAQDGVTPTVGVFNAALATMTNDKEMVKKLFGEMIALGVQPSLTTYRLVLGSACVNAVEDAVNYLHQILTRLEAQDQLEVIHRTDFEFFTVAMEIARKASSLSLGERLQALYISRKNKVQFPGLIDDDEFFGDYLRLLITEVHSNRMSLEEFDKRYRKIVPRHVTMTTDLIFECGDILKNKRNAPLALRFIDDIIASGFLLFSTGNRQIFSLIKGSDPKTLPPDQFNAMEAVLLRVVDLVDTFASHTNPRAKRKWTPQNLGMAAVALARFKQTARAWQLFNKLMPAQSSFATTTDTMEMEAAARAEVEDFGFAERADIEEMFDLALQTNDFVNACNAIEIFARYNNSSMNWMLAKVKSKLALSPPQLRIIENFIRLRDTK